MAVATESYMVGVENRLYEETHFKEWALAKMDEQDARISELKKDMKDMKAFKDLVNSRHRPDTKPLEPAMASNVPEKMSSVLSPTTPRAVTGNGTASARKVCRSPPSWDDSSSDESTKSPPPAALLTKGKASAQKTSRPARGARPTTHRSATPEGFFQLTFDETETQSPPPFNSQSDDA